MTSNPETSWRTADTGLMFLDLTSFRLLLFFLTRYCFKHSNDWVGLGHQVKNPDLISPLSCHTSLHVNAWRLTCKKLCHNITWFRATSFSDDSPVIQGASKMRYLGIYFISFKFNFYFILSTLPLY